MTFDFNINFQVSLYNTQYPYQYAACQQDGVHIFQCSDPSCANCPVTFNISFNSCYAAPLAGYNSFQYHNNNSNEKKSL